MEFFLIGLLPTLFSILVGLFARNSTTSTRSLVQGISLGLLGAACGLMGWMYCVICMAIFRINMLVVADLIFFLQLFLVLAIYNWPFSAKTENKKTTPR